MPPIKINGNVLDPETDRPALRASGIESSDSSGSDYILIQTSHPLDAGQKQTITDAGAKILEYVSYCTYLCRWEGQDLTPIYPNPNFPYISWANVYPQAFVVPGRLKAAVPSTLRALSPVSESQVERQVDVVVHGDVEPSPALRATLAEKAHVDPETISEGKKKFRLKVKEQYLDDIAAIDSVYFINEVLPNRLLNDVARKLLNADDIPVIGSGSDKYRGKGEVVAVADTGFDTGDASSTHPAFTNRVDRLYALGSTSPDDPDGHGTHVSGSVLGDGRTKAGVRVQGTAPEAHLVLQSVFSGHDASGNAGLGGIPFDLNDLFIDPYDNDGARVHTNSWGGFDPRDYDVSAREIDTFVCDHPDMVICFAAGNDARDRFPLDGVADLGQIGSQAFAKNCITVGASENERPNLGRTYLDITGSGFPRPPIVNDAYADNRNGMAAFSSRGAALDVGKPIRIKPDVVAPGTGILSTRSRSISSAGDIGSNINRFGNAPDDGWLYLAGTSMATPLVAGCCAILRESLFRDTSSPYQPTGRQPSAALIKALLINGAVELKGQYSPSEAGPSPNPSSGWGRVDLANSIIVSDPSNPTNTGYDEPNPLPEGKSHDFVIPIPGGDTPNHAMAPPQVPIGGGGDGGGSGHRSGKTLKITLVWSDRPSPVTSSGDQVLQNNLNLVVRVGSQECHGNRQIGDPSFDQVNNVEQVVWTNIPEGQQANISVRAAHYAHGGTQTYAYAWKIF